MLDGSQSAGRGRKKSSLRCSFSDAQWMPGRAAATWGLVARLWHRGAARAALAGHARPASPARTALVHSPLDSVGCCFLVMQRILKGIAVPRPLPFGRDSRPHTPTLGFLGAEMWVLKSRDLAVVSVPKSRRFGAAALGRKVKARLNPLLKSQKIEIT